MDVNAARVYPLLIDALRLLPLQPFKEREERGVDRHDDAIVVAVLPHLLRYWSDAPPERRHARRRQPHQICVVQGFDEIVSKVGNLPSAYPFVSSQETWLVENSGAGGFAALTAQPQGVWAMIGGLIAYRVPDAGIWSLGIVRHLKDEKPDRFLGIELVSEGGLAVSLISASEQSLEKACWAVWLVQDSSTSNAHVKLLVPKGMSRCQLLMTVHERKYLLLQHSVLLEGSDYQIALFTAKSVEQEEV